jgi:hypothetical protein
MESGKHEHRPRPSFEEVFRAFDEEGLQDFVVERDRSLPREIDVDWNDEGFEEFIGKWQAANSLRREKQEQATATTTADSSASLRNDSQKSKSNSKRRFPSGMTNK